LVLAVAVHRDEHLELRMLAHVRERRDQGRAVAAVLRMRDHPQVILPGENLAGTIGRAIVDDEDVAAKAPHLTQNALDGFFFVVTGKGGEKTHATRLNRKAGAVSKLFWGAPPRDVKPCFAPRRCRIVTHAD